MSVTGLIENFGGRVYSIVYINDRPILWFPTNQRAYEFLQDAFMSDDSGILSDVYLVLAIDLGEWKVRIPQIGHVTMNPTGDNIEYHDLFGIEYTEFCDLVTEEWPRIMEAINAK